MSSFLAAFLATFALAARAQDCSAPPPAANFNFATFAGSWFEIARIQTAGGNLIQQFCACTEIIYTPDAHPTNATDLDVNNSCRFESPSGFWLNATSYLNDGGAAGGHWIERYFPGGPPASYNIILTGTDARGVQWAVEYDCSNDALFGNNYVRRGLCGKCGETSRAARSDPPTPHAPLPRAQCLHFLSRQPLGFDAALLASLVKQTNVTMGLNPENRPLNMTMQQGCW